MSETATPDDLPDPAFAEDVRVEDVETPDFEFPPDEDAPADVDQTPGSDNDLENEDDVEDVEEDEFLDTNAGEESGSL